MTTSTSNTTADTPPLVVLMGSASGIPSQVFHIDDDGNIDATDLDDYIAAQQPFCPGCGSPGSNNICDGCQNDAFDQQLLEEQNAQQWAAYEAELYG